MMDVAFDETLGIVRCVANGPSTIAEVEVFVGKMAQLQEQARARRGSCLVLVDAMRSVVYSQEAAAIMERSARGRLKPGDRTAIMLSSAIAKMQAQRLTGDHPTGYFISEAEALAWLLADPA